MPSRSASLLGACLLLVSACFAEPTVGEPPDPGPDDTQAGEGGSAGSGSSGRGGRAGQGNAGRSGGSAGVDEVPGGGSSGAGKGGGAGQAPDASFSCEDAKAEPLRARTAITSGEVGSGSQGEELIVVTKQALFKQFEELGCGDHGCHGGADEPNNESPKEFRVTIDSFDDRDNLGEQALERILSDDPERWMPPEGEGGSKRGPNDPIRRLGERLLVWQKAGFPDSFEVTKSGEQVDPNLPTDPYALTRDLGEKLSNLGSCIPSRPAMLTHSVDEMREKDLLFASLETSDDLPDTIFETDLVSLESTALARRGVFSYAPTYPLYSDHAGKMRHVRVPVGKTIVYNPETRDFDIPENTRFYKTFLKEVKDANGDTGFRKMETRLIVSRPPIKRADGSFQQQALRAAYAWDKDERMARRVKDPFRDGTSAADRLCPYVVDEGVERDPTTNPIQQPVNENCTYMTQEELANPSSGQIRHYAIPSTQRCDQCHMGSHNKSYILGFDPFQVDRRPDGEGGVFEAPQPDELTQLARLIEYGVISGIEPGQVKLEDSQGTRKPRNEHELKAQAYMIGNCAFCHNPNGFPVVENPILRDFELYPNEDTGGIFQFSLEKFSPRAKGSSAQNIRIPYITPAFGDLNFDGSGRTNQIEKFANVPEPPVVDADDYPADYDPVDRRFTFLGPWRSLIWRNVYTPFTYEEDGTVFVHMPRNAAGYDCRAQHIMAEWMLSIPSKPKASNLGDARVYDQPVAEVRWRVDSNRDFDAAVKAANERIKDYNHGVTGSWCPEDTDLVDPKVLNSPIDVLTGEPELISPPDRGISGSRLVKDYPFPDYLRDAVPDHAHWVTTDTTDRGDRWKPRRDNWKKILVTQEVRPTDLVPVIDHLQTVFVTPELEPFAIERLPMGLWHRSCASSPEIASEPMSSDLAQDTTAPLHRWLRSGVIVDESQLVPGKVHRQSRGETVFRAICQNCHGKFADSKSPLASTILELTGGRTRVANFVDGLLGPRTAPGAFSRGEFLIDFGGSPDDWQARYVLYMGLGGTSANIPRVVLDLVGTSPFYGNAITAPGGDNPNMLGSAQALCGSVLTGARRLEGEAHSAPRFYAGAFAQGTGHYELWESICAFNNLPLVRVFTTTGAGAFVSQVSDVYRVKDDAGAWVYPPDRLVGHPNGEIQTGINSQNPLPWCIRVNSEAELADVREWAAASGVAESRVPLCPDSLFAEVVGKQIYRLALNSSGPDNSELLGNQDFARSWLLQGAMNAGLVALQYLRALTSGEVEPAKPFDFCIE